VFPYLDFGQILFIEEGVSQCFITAEHPECLPKEEREKLAIPVPTEGHWGKRNYKKASLLKWSSRFLIEVDILSEEQVKNWKKEMQIKVNTELRKQDKKRNCY